MKDYHPEEENILVLIEKNQKINYDVFPSFYEFIKRSKSDIKNKIKFEELSPKIANHGYGVGGLIVYAYCKKNKKRLPEKVEVQFLNGCYNSWKARIVVYKYARYIIKDKYPESIEKNIKLTYDYLGYLIKNNKPYIDILIENSELAYLFYRENLHLPDVVHNAMIMKKMMEDRHANYYFNSMKKNNKIINKVLSNFDEKLTIKELKGKIR